MAEQTIADWLRSEHEQVNVLSDRLRECIAVVPRVGVESWIVDTRSCFEHLRAHFLHHIALEEHKGYLNCVLEQRPTLEPRVQRLAHEHRELIQLLDNLHRSLADLTQDDHLLVRDSCHRIRDLLQFIDHHQEKENNLVQLVFTEDLGING